jgi:hypothetical protein
MIFSGHLSVSAACIRFLLVSSQHFMRLIGRWAYFDITSFKPAQVFSRTPSITSSKVIPAGRSLFKLDTISHKSLYRPKTDKGEGEWFRLSSTSSLPISSFLPRTRGAYDNNTTLSTTSIHPCDTSNRANSSCNPSRRCNIVPVPSPPSSEFRSTINLDNLSTSPNLLLDNP